MFHVRSADLPRELDEGYAFTFNRLSRLFRSRGVPREEAADMAQESIARALLHLTRRGTDDSFEGIDPLLNRIATNLLIDRVRRARPLLVPIDDVEVHAGDDPEDEITRRDESHAVRSAMASLPERHREALELSLDGKSPAEIALAFGIRRNAADALLFRARRRLADHLRVSGRIALGFALLVARARAAVRRGASAGVEHLGASPMAMNLAAAAAVALLVLPGVGSGIAGASDEAVGRRPAAVTSTVAMTGAREIAPTRKQTERATGARSVVERRVGFETTWSDPVGGEHTTGAGVSHEQTDGDRGVTGPIVGDLIDAGCEVAPDGVCASGEPRP